MKTLSEFTYTRPNIDAYKERIQTLIDTLSNASSAAEALDAVNKINDERQTIFTTSTLTSVRHSCDTRDEFYEKEQNFWDENSPYIDEMDDLFFKAINSSPFLDELKKVLPETFFKLIEFNLRTFDPIIIEDLQEENRLSTAYDKLLASAQIPFDGKTLTLPQLTPYMQSPDRSVREAANVAKTDFFETHEKEIDDIYDKLVKTRARIAEKLGFKNFVELGYYRMSRFDYDAKDVAKYREEILKHVVPVTNKLYKEQQERIGVDKFMYYDKTFEFPEGNAKPKGTPEEIITQAQEMYREMSSETGKFFDFMIEGELLDLVSRDGKQGGGYCTYIPNYKSPFIFSNFNGTSGDIDVLTHEAGHAFQVFESRWVTVPECVFPTYESCEIHSMSMEFFAWPYMDKFFKEDTPKYLYEHIGSALKFLPYGVLVDHFQHEMYEHPEYTPAERKAAWRKLEKQYLPHIDYGDNEFLERGGFWFQQGHIFSSPFYYIDYTLAQVCAFQFWKRAIIDKDASAWNDYLKICQIGGTKTFLQIVGAANLKNPFVEGSLEESVHAIDTWLNENKKNL